MYSQVGLNHVRLHICYIPFFSDPIKTDKFKLIGNKFKHKISYEPSCCVRHHWSINMNSCIIFYTKVFDGLSRKTFTLWTRKSGRSSLWKRFVSPTNLRRGHRGFWETKCKRPKLLSDIDQSIGCVTLQSFRPITEPKISKIISSKASVYTRKTQDIYMVDPNWLKIS